MSSLVDTVKMLGPARLAVLGVVFMALMIFFGFVTMQVSRPSMSLLYSDLSTVDSSSVAASLEEKQIEYEISADGTTVFVKQTDIGRARMLLAEEGLPNGGSIGYEIFDQQSGFGTTSFVQNINQLRALQGELQRTISSLDPVQSALVNIVLPERELFSREARQASASITLKLNPKYRLQQQQIYAIQNLVANAVPELRVDNVTIIDTDANMLAGGQDSDPEGVAGSMRSEEKKLAFERRMSKTIEDMVGRIVGFGNVRANVSADLNFDRITTNSEIYDPEGQVVRSTQSISEDNTERDGVRNEVGVEQNLPGLGDDINISEQPSSQNNRTEEVTNFEISKTSQSVFRESGQVERMSVGVLVNGRYETDEEGNMIYQPRSEEELDKISALIRSAIGFDAARGDTIDVINMEFTRMEVADVIVDNKILGFDKADLLDTAEMFVLALMGILIVLLVLKPLVSQLMASQIRELEEQAEAALVAAEEAAALPKPERQAQSEAEEEEDSSLLDMTAVAGRVKASTVKKVGDIVTNHPNETVSVIRNWMSQE